MKKKIEIDNGKKKQKTRRERKGREKKKGNK